MIRRRKCISPTDHEVGDAGEDDGRDGPQRDDVRQDLTQEVDGHPVVTADVFMTAEDKFIISEHTVSSQGSGGFLQ